MDRRTTGLAVLVLAFVEMQAASAQQVAVQEPSLETFGVGTTVSVPDRGRTSLGGVGRSAAFRSTYGPIRAGTSLGLSSQGTGLSVGVKIQDLAEMDRAALEAAGKARKSRTSVELSGQAQHAYDTLQARRRARDPVTATDIPAAAGPAVAAQERRGPSAEKLLEKARHAEADGRRKLALTYLRAARDQGSVEAAREISRLDGKTR